MVLRRRCVPGPAVALVALGVLGACGGGSGASATTTSSEAAVSSTTTSVVSTPAEADVLDAYAASWGAFGALVNGEATDDPTEYYDGDQLDIVEARIRQYAEEGLELRGSADLAPGRVSIVGQAASLVDCQIDRTYAVDRATGSTVIPAGARPQEVVVELVRSDGRWKVTSADYGAEGSCER
ncbi:MAG: hypothetical protein ABL966_15535 [Acidimicrobiales bacterium]